MFPEVDYRPFILILGFVAIIFAAYFTTRLIGMKGRQLNHSKFMKVVDRIMVGNDKWVCIIQVGGLYYLIGVTNHNIDFLGQIDEKNIVPIAFDNPSQFSSLLNKYFNKRKGEKNKTSIDMDDKGWEKQLDKIKRNDNGMGHNE
ncbi:flagellar biosynthetic protein FliO [Xylanivirga thermophila]|jgi:flagellar protein FliO/FliZ|uniref:flagellar biosynthetic protein FliO n=1 Tax=Xylanivirga thermophila TaxID=2496273 RepID=UPI00101D6DF3|nr:flagellar biosynthetic protein FliO [Xylanivirga thermophila]